MMNARRLSAKVVHDWFDWTWGWKRSPTVVLFCVFLNFLR